MRYVNNWITRLTAGLDSDGDVLPVDPGMLARLDLSGGEQYTLTLVSTLDPLQQNAVEVVTISASGGGHILTRAREGTSAQDWPFETYVYACVTAGILEQLESGAEGVSSFNGRSGAVLLTDDDVIDALAYIPVNPASLATVATSGNYDDLGNAPHIPAEPWEIGAATAAQGDKADSAVQPAALTAGLATKVDKVAGYGLSQENYTSAEKTKLAGLESSHFKGLHASLAALQAAHPTGAAGDYADVDAGVGVDVVRYLWDVSDAQWVAQASSGSSMTPAQIKTAYESNPDTNAFSDAEQSKLAGVAAGATSNPNTTSLAEGSNLYFTTARVLATVLSGLSLATGGAIVGTDTVLAAFGKLQKQLNDHFGAGGSAHANAVASGAAGFMTGADKAKLDGIAAGAAVTSVNGRNGAVIVTIPLIVACSDETTALTAGTSKVTFHMPYAYTLTEVIAELVTPQTSGAIFTVDINEAGVSILSTKLTIDNTEETSLTAATPPVISDAALAKGAKITVDIDQIGDGTAKGLKIHLIGYQP